MSDHTDPETETTDADGVTDGPGESPEPTGDPKKVGPDGTVYDDDAVEEVREKMGLDDD